MLYFFTFILKISHLSWSHGMAETYQDNFNRQAIDFLQSLRFINDKHSVLLVGMQKYDKHAWYK